MTLWHALGQIDRYLRRVVAVRLFEQLVPPVCVTVALVFNLQPTIQSITLEPSSFHTSDFGT
jgi:hypothetical protein